MNEQVREIYLILSDCDKESSTKCAKYSCDMCMAQRLYEEGYRKIPQNGAVLTEKENVLWLDFVKGQKSKAYQEIIEYVEQKDNKAGKYSIYSKLLEELREKFTNEKQTK